MKQTVLVTGKQAHPALIPGKTEHTFISRPWINSASRLYPSYYSLSTLSNGGVIRTDYDSAQEYNHHKASVIAEITKQHAKTGKRIGCDCGHCKMGL